MAGEIELETTVDTPIKVAPLEKAVEKTAFLKFLSLFPKILTKTPVNATEEQVNGFLKGKNYYVVQKMVEHGYQLNDNQAKKVQSYLSTLLSPIDIVKTAPILEDWLKLGITLPDLAKKAFIRTDIIYSRDDKTHYLGFLLETSDNIVVNNVENSTQSGTEYPLLTQSLRKYIKENAKEGKIFKEIFSELSLGVKKHDIFSIQHILEMIGHPEGKLIFKDIPLEDYLPLFNFTKKVDWRGLPESLQKGLKDHYENRVNDLVLETKKEYGSNYISNAIANQIVQDSRNHTVEQLPPAATKLLDDINEVYKKVSISGKEIPGEIFDINNLFEKRLPEVLKKYLTIDPLYRTTMTNREGKNAEELMIDSLENIKSNFENAWQSINEQQLSSLSVTNKYTKNFKK